MRSLFWKIFLWFWAAQILIGASLYVLALATQRGFDERFRSEIADNLEARGRASAIIYEYGGAQALREVWNLRTRTSTRRRNFTRRRGGGAEDRASAALFSVRSSRPTRLIGRPLPDEILPLVAQAAREGEASTPVREDGSWLARHVLTPRGARYVAIERIRPPPGRLGPLEWRRDISGIFSRFLVVALTLGAVCYALARYLTGPIFTLRRATRQLAEGRLSTRVGAQMGKRRDELTDLGRDFDVMAERIESLMNAERRLLADISHELRSPLARLQLTLELVEDEVEEKSREYLARMKRESGRLNDLIEQLLTLTRLESAATQTRHAPLDLAVLVGEVAGDADFEARSRNRSVHITQSDECSTTGDAELLRRAIENVVRNAVYYTPENTQVELALRRERADAAPSGALASTRDAGALSMQVVISVRDMGSGVPEESLQRVFDPFYRVADARDRQSGGVGLGLSITARAVRLHGGQVAAKNAPGGGLLVEIRLPLAARERTLQK